MANPLELGMTSPAAPNPDAGQGNALQQGGMAQPQQQQIPPSHEQTVAALRHFDAIRDELNILLKNPSLGRSSIKQQIIDGCSSLVGKRILSPAEAVMQLAKVPDNPLEQRKMLQQQMAQTVQAEHSIIAQHATGFAGHGPMPTPSDDDHMGVMSGLHAQLGGK